MESSTNPPLTREVMSLMRCLHLFELILEKEDPGRQLVQKEGVSSGKFLDVVIDFPETSFVPNE